MLFLNESTEVNGEEHVDIENDFVVQDTYTGDDTELLDIMVTHEQDMHNLTIAMMRAEHRAVVSEDMTIAEAAEGSFIQRVWSKIKEFWAKIVSFFSSLWSKVTGLFQDREKWVNSNKLAIERGASNATMSLPANFAKWNGADRISSAQKNVDKMFTDVSHKAKAAAGGAQAKAGGVGNVVMGRAKQVWNGILLKEFGVQGVDEKANYSDVFNKAIGEMKDMSLGGGVIKTAMREATATKAAKIGLSQVKAAEKAALARAKAEAKDMKQAGAALNVINQKSSTVASFTKALHNTVIKMCNYGWAACRKAASTTKKVKEGTDLDDITDVNHDEENDALSQYMSE